MTEKENRIHSLALSFLGRQQIVPNLYADQIIRGYKEGYHQAEKDLKVKEVENTELLKVRGYLVRDKDDYTAIYAEKPHRGKIEWVDSNNSCLMTINDARLVPDIEFEDEPVEVELTLKRLNTRE